MKIPAWAYKHETVGVQHYASTLKDAARAIEINAALLRPYDRDGARTCRAMAEALREVAGGKTWAEALNFPDPKP